MKGIIALISVVLILIFCVILFKCNNPVKKEVAKLKTEHAVAANQKTIAAIQKTVTDTTTHRSIRDAISGVTTVHAQKVAAVGTKKQIDMFYKPVLNKIAKATGSKSNKIDNFEQHDLTVDALLSGSASTLTFSANPIEKPTAYRVVTFANPFLDARVVIDSPYKDSSTLSLHIPIKETSVLIIQRPHHFLGIRFGRPQYIQDVSSDNPYAHIDSIQVVKIIKR